MSDHFDFRPSDVDRRLALVLTRDATGNKLAGAEVGLPELGAHGVDGLAAATPVRLPTDLQSDLRGQAVALQFWEDRHRLLIAEAIGALSAAGIPSVLIKGTSCAYSVYDQPWARTRGDSDLMIAPTDRSAAIKILKDMGFVRGVSFDDDVTVAQASFTRRDSGPGFSHVIDLHWQLNNSPVLSRVLAPEELLSRSLPLPRLADTARGACPVDALLIACLHRYVHRSSPYTVDQTQHYTADRLIWLMDIHLIAQAMKRPEWDDFLRSALKKGLAQVCASCLASSKLLFETQIPDQITRALRCVTALSAPERYLLANRRGRITRDFLARDGLAGKAAFLRAHLFPPEAYMRARFEGGSNETLALLYLRRARQGFGRSLRSTKAG